MMDISSIVFILKAFTALWSLILLAVVAASIASFDSKYLFGASFDSGRAVLAMSILVLIYFVVAFFLLKKFNVHVINSVLVDTIVIGFFFIFALGSVAALSDIGQFFRRCSGDSACSLGSASIGLGWILVFLLLAILLIEVIYTYRTHGTSLEVWKTPFTELGSGGSPSRGVEHQAELGTLPTTQVNTAPATTAPVGHVGGPATTV